MQLLGRQMLRRVVSAVALLVELLVLLGELEPGQGQLTHVLIEACLL